MTDFNLEPTPEIRKELYFQIEDLIKRIKDEGKVYLSSTGLKIKEENIKITFIRFSVLSFRSHQEHVDLAVSTISNNIDFIEKEILKPTL